MACARTLACPADPLLQGFVQRAPVPWRQPERRRIDPALAQHALEHENRQTLALSPALSIADNMFLGREIRKSGVFGRWFRSTDRKAMESRARAMLSELGLATIQNISQAVETLSGGQRQGVAVARAAASAPRW